MNTEKLMFAFKYAKRIAFKFQHIRYSQEDLVQDFMLFLLEHPERLEEMIYVKSFVYRNLQWNRNNFAKKAENKKVFNYIDKPIEYLETESNYLDLNDFGQINSIEDNTEILLVREFLHSKHFSNSTNKTKGKKVETFELMLSGYTSEQIGGMVKMTRFSVNESISETRKKIKKYFKK